MGNWQERIEKAFSEQRFREQQAEIARREQERQREAERQQWQHNHHLKLQEAARLVSELQFRRYLEIARHDVWQGLGDIAEIGGGDNSWIGLELVYKYPLEIVSSGYISDSGVYAPSLRPSVGRGWRETFSDLTVNFYSNTVDINDGDREFIRWDNIGPYKNINTIIANSRYIPIAEARPELVDETLLQFSIDRIKHNRLPRQLGKH